MRGLASMRTVLTASCAAVLLSSCASYQGIEPTAALQPVEQYETGRSLPAEHGQWPDASWAASIGGAPLQVLVDEALAGNPNLQVAAARVAAARAVAEVAGANREIKGSAAFQGTYQRYTENGLVPAPLAGTYESDNSLTLNFSYDLDFWGRHAAEYRSALSQDKAAQAEQYNARLMISTAVARAWVQLAREHALRDLNQQQLDVAVKLQHLMQLRLRAGLDDESNLQQVEQALAFLRAQQSSLDEGIALTRNQLAALLGKGPDRGRDIARPQLPGESAVALPDELPLVLLGRRPDLVAARWRVEAAQGGIDAGKAAFYPNINLTAFAGFSSLGLSNLLESGSRIAGIGPAITLPILSSGTLRGSLKQQVANYDALVATYNQALTEALRDVADQVQSLRAAQQQSMQQHAGTQAAAASLKLAQERERVGTTNMLPVLLSQLGLLAQQRNELDSLARRSDLRIALIKALGGGFEAQALGLNRDIAPASTDSTLVKNAS
ncbi:MarR family transcriptional regulator [Oxalicibacterium flavum]|uniref:MarR family transcriptional regulator n=1 Tax=Oxalicibacterium flavum TaxID=179467 RepID=A0A8J2XUK3_9BURK|nr:efflux transporter outer membrane subunit [Oxalicibacterium flavum]GGB94935.1 MarR family transcriptional regulator [Oxalicibacterium flavum]